MYKYVKIGIGVVLAVVIVGWVASIQFESSKNTYSGLPTLQKPAPNFVLKNVDGDSVSLTQFKGKLVYLKFWASWCGDCMRQVVPQRKLQASLADDNKITFIDISVDDDLDAWNKSVVRNKLPVVELISRGGEESGINDKYAVSEIPRYILIGQDGVVLDNNAPKPSEIDASYFSNFLK